MSTLGCSKKDVPPAVGTGTLRTDGALISCKVTASISTRATAGRQYDYLLVTMQATPESASSEVVRIELVRPAGQPALDYNFSSVTYFTSSSSAGTLYKDATNASVGETSKGVFSGNFQATSYSAPIKNITGMFTNARL
jgi:hypothetical protein